MNKKSSQPLYIQLAELLLPEIKKIPVGDRFFPERQIARDYKTGLIVARAALQKLAREGYLKRVVSRGTFVVSHTATRRASRNPLKIIVFCPLGNSLPHGDAVREIMDILAHAGHTVEMRNMERNSSNAGRLIAVAARDCDGVIFINSVTEFITEYPPALPTIAEKTVFINPLVNHPALTCVLRDNYGAVRALTTHLLNHDYAKTGSIGFAGDNSRRMFVTERRRGYTDALQAHGMEPDRKYMYMDTGGVQFNHGYELADKLLRNRKRMPRALVCCTDYQAMGVTARLKEKGVRVPEDMAITGFDNTLQAEQFVPALTTADQAYRPMGALAVNLLLSQTSGALAPGTKAYVPCPIHIRHSCGCQTK